MTTSSRTPEGLPHRCPTCGAAANLEPSYPGGDSCCPSCGRLLWWFRDRLSASGALPKNTVLNNTVPESIGPSTSFTELGVDSVDLVELFMEFEEEFGLAVPDDVAARINTIGDAMRYLSERRRA